MTRANKTAKAARSTKKTAAPTSSRAARTSRVASAARAPTTPAHAKDGKARTAGKDAQRPTADKKLKKRAARRAPVAPADAALETYLALLEEIWRDVHPLIGAVTLSALFKSAARRLSPAHSCIANLEVSIEGVDRSALREKLGDVSSAEAIAALRDLIRDLLTLFESIAGAVIVRMLLPKIVRAESGELPASAGVA
jgi:hypothetical protein